MRSVGKFFGLAGIRVGFVIAEQYWLDVIEDAFGPWAVSGPSRWVCQQAMDDISWQQKMCVELRKRSERLHELLYKRFQLEVKGTAMFRTCMMIDAVNIYRQLAEQGILVRLLDCHNGLRFGLPADEAGFKRLEKALSYT